MELTDRQTLRRLLEKNGFRFSKAKGQNFLTAAWVPDRIAAESGITEEDGVLEIGPGVGVLTTRLARQAAAVAAVELDRTLEAVLTETLEGLDNVAVVYADALKTDLKALCREKLGDRPWKVCANLPYNVTKPLITAFLEAGCFETVTVMVQREVARRLCARPGTEEYGAFTVLVDWYAQAEALFDVPPECFVPRPGVVSTVVQLTVRPAPPVAVEDRDFFFRVVRAAFGQRRKTLPNALCAGMPELSRPAVERAVAGLGLDGRVRGEALSLEQFASLANALYAS